MYRLSVSKDGPNWLQPLKLYNKLSKVLIKAFSLTCTCHFPLLYQTAALTHRKQSGERTNNSCLTGRTFRTPAFHAVLSSQRYRYTNITRHQTSCFHWQLRCSFNATHSYFVFLSALLINALIIRSQFTKISILFLLSYSKGIKS